MGRLIKNHWARLIVLTAAAYQLAAALEAFFWPKIFWDFLSHNLDRAVTPIPFLQVINLIFAVSALALEWPLKYIAGTSLHRSIELRLIIIPLYALASILLYQGTNPAIYYIIAEGIYFWGFSEGETICERPWTLPVRVRRSELGGSKV
ncbi:hypothetical protein P152DRAFT_299325 [Eremomyces bilateralis CBS 781.70]|uniref:DUF7727 domain-containing protein n=1 Tax=Eremomyces bilateralis CBS 781.70 TaxID=1392243 RepID=A0A6G1G7Q6_9PEZI|nr:uncharacterized protein P152DRAFT_299325 [Eremomyces bilateralis CBS 781.70]KAF1813966.1 hypothetical protein P152DRAFT_299325 [Eremomyces bilateralis CBS 781.70]